jgi:hypothetical protein
MKYMKLLKSKTFWFNLVTGAVTIADALNGRVIPVEVSGAVIAVGNIILRLMTNKPIEEK